MLYSDLYRENKFGNRLRSTSSRNESHKFRQCWRRSACEGFSFNHDTLQASPMIMAQNPWTSPLFYRFLCEAKEDQGSAILPFNVTLRSLS